MKYEPQKDPCSLGRRPNEPKHAKNDMKTSEILQVYPIRAPKLSHMAQDGRKLPYFMTQDCASCATLPVLVVQNDATFARMGPT